MNVDQIYEIWRGLKMAARFGGQVSADAMHINLGLIGFFAFLALYRQSRRPAIYALLTVFSFQVINEVTDIFFDVRNLGTVKEWNTIRDTLLTLFWPSIFTIYLLKRKDRSK